MIECDSCRRHHRATEERCPFCATRRSPGSALVMNAVGAALASFVLAACYGGTPTDKYSATTGETGGTGTPTTATSGGSGLP